jgi:DNA-binding CsgD family transcriptional regulator
VTRFSQRELRGALEVVQLASSAENGDAFPEPLLEQLAALVPADQAGYYEWDHRALLPPTVAVELPAVTTPAEVAEARAAYCSTYPLSVLRRSAETRALKISDFLSLRMLRRLDYYDHVLRPFRIEHQMRLWLAAPPGTSRVFYFSRRGSSGDFGERDRGLLELLRPFLVARRRRLGRPARNADGYCLTDRETEVLEWVARGKTNDEIAAALVVSPHTVRKHLEHAYEKLGVHTRTAAVHRAFAHLNGAAPAGL